MSQIDNKAQPPEKKDRTTIVIPLAVAIIGAIATIIAALIIIHGNSSDRAGSSTPSVGSTSSAVPVPNCPPAGQPGVKQVHIPSMAEDNILADPIYYTATAVDQKVFLGAGGRFKSSIPPDENFFALWAADPTTTDSAHKPGDGVYRKFQNFSMTEDCWLRPNVSMPNDEAKGLTYRIELILVDDAHLNMFMTAAKETGFDENKLNLLAVTRLAYLEIPTKDL